jgi:hypothetical protein
MAINFEHQLFAMNRSTACRFDSNVSFILCDRLNLL